VNLSAQAIADVNRHTKLIAVSNATRHFHVDQGIDPAKCNVLYNGADLDEFRPRRLDGWLHRELNIPPESHLIAVVGQLGLRKGTDVALTAAAEVARTSAGVHWLIIGARTSEKRESHKFEERLHHLASQPPLLGKVHFLGVRGDLAALLPECTLLVHAARQEPLGRVLLEAAACGLTIVATNTGGTPEIFPAASESAVLTPADDATQLAQAILALLDDPTRRHSLSAAARRRAETAFDIRKAAAGLVNVYSQTIAP
jgi:glycosyltransferase involved in cell wall biosynthesis